MAGQGELRELRDRLERLGGLVSVRDLAEEWGMSKQRADAITQSKGFPAPVTGPGAGRARYWLRAEVEEWAAQSGRARARHPSARVSSNG